MRAPTPRAAPPEKESPEALSSRGTVLRVSDLGLVDYGDTLALQRTLREARIAGQAPDTLLLLEHPPTITLGRSSGPGELLRPQELLEEQGFRVYEVERGGRITYHGPGQLVGYPIIHIRELGIDVPRHISVLEQLLIDFLAALGLQSERRPGFPGVWTGGRKIAAVGVHFRRGVSMHGFALNLRPELAPFDAIVPCGIAGVQVTSVEAELGRCPSVAESKRAIAERFRELFGYSGVEWGTAWS